ncbi:tetratricopeptide repeat protein [Roseinatronobacter alkalisoli]|uniref:Tetratricopeptide repeat protein n=1 Tax=Roseinatronobacter alkalisoli TaxID=3028235 RepID=A0ABT5T9G4_9RHOB|nr:tetratricopeptide repeat protein [Roseinatronobacter sp. HJB301]MDD7970563.1 tetratricopeptide repeat protein [Roseinatronobacter sp. HJB301]
MIDFIRDEATVLQALAAMAALVLFVWGMLWGLGRFVRWLWVTPAPAKVDATITYADNQTRLTLPDFIRIRRDLKAEILEELGRTDVVEERAQLQARIDELTAQINDPESAFAAERKRLADLEARLLREGNELGADRLQAAIDALRQGDTDLAEGIFSEIAEREAMAVQRAARAEFGLGEIAEGRVDWASAARHYARAADLDPSYDSLGKAGKLLFHAGQYEAALAANKTLVTLSQQEHGPRDPKTAIALNNYAESLKSLGHYDQAEPLLRDALAIGRETLGDRHPTVATRLNNLALLLWATERLDEAEPLIRQALEIDREALGSRHPAVAIDLSNLAGLLQVTEQVDEAEPLYRQALEIDRDALGERHPVVAITLNNLAALLQATGRTEDAEPLYGLALEISRETLGDRHPDVATRLNNLAGLLRKTNRAGQATPLYLEALGISRAALGDAHPDTQTTARNTLRHLRQHAPDHPDLSALAAVFDAPLPEGG